MVYATKDMYEGKIAEGADIKAFGSEAEAREYALEGYDPASWNHATSVVEPVDVGDAWVKVYGDFGDDETFEPFTRDQLTISEPGAHPGGRCTWIEPRVPVLGLTRIDEIGDED